MRNQILRLLLAGSLLVGALSVHSQGDAFDKGFSLRFGLNLPNSSFGGFDDFNSNWGIANPGTPRAYTKGSSLGFGLQLGSMFFFDGIDLGSQMAIGLDVSYIDLNYIPVNYEFKTLATGRVIGESKMHYFQMGFMVGPTFSFSLVDNMSFDVAFKFNPSWSGFAAGVDLNDEPTNTNYNDTYGGISYFQLGYVPAIYFRYSILFLGFEYNINNGNHNMVNDDHSSFVSNKTNMSRMKFLFGFKF